MAGIILNRILEDENAAARNQNIARTKSLASQKGSNKNVRTAFGELSNTFDNKRKSDISRLSKNSVKKDITKQKNQKFEKSAKKVVKLHNKIVVDNKEAVECADEIESVPMIKNYNEEEEYDEFTWSKAERLSSFDLKYLKTFNQRKKPVQKDLILLNSPDEDLMLSLDFVTSAPSKETVESPLDNLLFDDSVYDPVPLSDCEDDIIYSNECLEEKDSPIVDSVAEWVDQMTP